MNTDTAMLVLRLVVGGIMFGHGAQKLFGWFGGYGLQGTGGFMGGMLRLRPGVFWAGMAGLSEAGGGLLLGLGLLNPLGSLGIIAAMVMATVLAHWPHFWVSDNGYEYPLVNATVAAAVIVAGPGAYSLDAALGIALPEPATAIVGLAGVALGIATALATRAPKARAIDTVLDEAAGARAA